MRIQSYNSFWQRIHRVAKTEGFPLRVMFELTYRCNFRCRHCYVPQSYSKKGELKTKEVFSVLEQLRDIGCFYLGFTGGEPFIRKDIIDILCFAKKKGFEIIIYTNGSLINEEITQELQRIRPNKVDITIPGMSKAAFEGVAGVAGSRDRVFKTINLLYKSGVNLGFKTCVLKENESEIKDIQDFVHSLGALHRLGDMLSARLDGSKEPYRFRGCITGVVSRKSYVVSGKSDVRFQMRDCDFSTGNRIPKTDSLFKCGVGISQAAITPQGELKMCLMIDYPKYRILNNAVVSRKSYVVSDNSEVRVQKSDLKGAWERLKKLVVSIKPDENYQCDKCKLYTYCKWCPAKGWLYNRTFTSCEPESRRWAEIRSQKSEVRSQMTEVRR